MSEMETSAKLLNEDPGSYVLLLLYSAVMEKITVVFQYPEKPYRIPHHPNEWVIIPFKMIDEIKNAPESKLSFQQDSYDFFTDWHTGITNHDRAVANILKTSINRLIDVVYAVVQDESLRTVLGNLGPCEGIHAFNLQFEYDEKPSPM